MPRFLASLILFQKFFKKLKHNSHNLLIVPFVSTNNNHANQKTTCLLSFRSHVLCLFWETENKLWELSGRTLSVSDIACVASVSVWFRSKKRPWKGIFGFDRARIEMRTKKCLVRHSLLLNRTETLVTQAISDTSLATYGAFTKSRFNFHTNSAVFSHFR